MPLDRQLELLALENLVVVNVEKVAVENRLDNTGDDGDPVHLVLGLGKVAVDPVGDVQRAVASEGEEIMGRDGLSLARALQHEQLRENGHGLEPDGEGPQDLGRRVLVGEDERESGRSAEEVLHAEGIDVEVVRRLVGVGHEVDDVALRANEEDLEDEVVEAVGRKEICARLACLHLAIEHRQQLLSSIPRYLVRYTSRYSPCDLKEMPEQLYATTPS